MPPYNLQQLDKLEEDAEKASQEDQLSALQTVSTILKQQNVTNGVPGGMNFSLRGSHRVTSDVNIAVDCKSDLGPLIKKFEKTPGIHWPKDKFLYTKAARLYVDTGKRIVQVDLLKNGDEDFGIPKDLGSAVESYSVLIANKSFSFNLLKVVPLVATKLNAYYSRETPNDYSDLLFACTSGKTKKLVEDAARHTRSSDPYYFRKEWRFQFWEHVKQKDSAFEEMVRTVLALDPAPAPAPGSSKAAHPSSQTTRPSPSTATLQLRDRQAKTPVEPSVGRPPSASLMPPSTNTSVRALNPAMTRTSATAPAAAATGAPSATRNTGVAPARAAANNTTPRAHAPAASRTPERTPVVSVTTSSAGRNQSLMPPGANTLSLRAHNPAATRPPATPSAPARNNAPRSSNTTPTHGTETRTTNSDRTPRR